MKAARKASGWSLNTGKEKKCNHVIISGEGNANCVYLK